MFIKSLKLEGFGKFRAIHLEFDPGLNLILGPNEAGKSTLVNAIFGLLFGLGDKKYSPWEGGEYRGSLVLAEAAEQAEVERSFATNEVEVREGASGTRIEGKVPASGKSSTWKSYMEWLRGWVGTDDQEVLRRTVLVGQMELQSFQPGEGKKKDKEGQAIDKLKRLLTGGADYQEALKGLVTRHEKVTKYDLDGKIRGSMKDRELELISQRIEELKGRLNEAEQAAPRLRHLRDEVERLKLEAADIQSEMKKNAQLLQEMRNYNGFREKKESLSGAHARLDKDREEREKNQKTLEDIEREKNELGPITNLPEELWGRLPHYTEYRQRLEKKALEVAVTSEQLAALPLPRVRQVLIPILLLPLIIGYLVYTFRGDLWFIVAILVAGLLYLVVDFLRRSIKIGKSRTRLEERLKITRMEYDEVQRKISDLEEAFSRAGVPLQAEGYPRLKEQHGRLVRLTSREQEVRGKLSVLPAADAIRESILKVTADLGPVRERMTQMEGSFPFLKDVTPDQLEAREEKERELEGEFGRLQAQLSEAQNSLIRAEHSAESPLSLREEITHLEKDRAEIADTRDALAIAINTLKDCLEEFRRSFLSGFGREIGGRLSVITGGKYSGVTVDEDFNLLVEGEGTDKVDSQDLSQGTTDQLHFSIRLALSRALKSRGPLPFILDDPFYNYDEERLGNTLSMLKEIAREHQVLLFSHREELAARLKLAKVVRL